MKINAEPSKGTHIVLLGTNDKGSKSDENLDRNVWNDCPQEEKDVKQILVNNSNQEGYIHEGVIMTIQKISDDEATYEYDDCNDRTIVDEQELLGRESAITSNQKLPKQIEVQVVGTTSLWTGRSMLCDEGVCSDADVTLDEMHKEVDQEEELVLRDILDIHTEEKNIKAPEHRNPTGNSRLAPAMYGSSDAGSIVGSIAGQETIREIIMHLEDGEPIGPTDEATYRSWTEFNPIAGSVASGPANCLPSRGMPHRPNTAPRFVNDDCSVGSWTEDMQVIVNKRLQDVTDDTGTVANQNTLVSSLSNDTFGLQPRPRMNQAALPEPLPWWIVAEAGPFEEEDHPPPSNGKSTESHKNRSPQGDGRPTTSFSGIDGDVGGDLEAPAPRYCDRTSKQEPKISSRKSSCGFLRRSVKESATVRRLFLLSAVFLAAFIALGVVILLQSRNGDLRDEDSPVNNPTSSPIVYSAAKPHHSTNATVPATARQSPADEGIAFAGLPDGMLP